MLKINSRLEIPDSELVEEFFLSSGPGGQNVNKVATAVRLEWNVAASQVLSEEVRARLLERLAGKLTSDGVLAVSARSARTQLQNREEAALRLTALVRGALVVPRKRRPTKPTQASVERRLDSKKKRASLKLSRRAQEGE